MKKLFIIFSLILFLFIITAAPAFADSYYYDGSFHSHNENVRLIIDSNDVICDVPPLIVNDRTLVPARAFFEKLGALVSWNASSKEVTISKNGLYILLKIDSLSATVNTKDVSLDVPAKIITDTEGTARTMIPVRFVSEYLGYDVTWDGTSMSVLIQTQKDKNVVSEVILSSITGISTETSQTKDIVFISVSTKAEPKIMQLSNPDRLVLDFYGYAQEIGGTALNKSGACFSNIRFANHNSEYARIVVDISSKYSYTTESYNDKFVVVLNKTGDIAKQPENNTPVKQPDNNTSAKQPDNNTSENKADANQKTPAKNGTCLVVIDAGHGGSDPGAIGKADGKDVYESKANLNISLKVRDILVKNGISVKMTREKDVFLELGERSDFANEQNCALFICIHNNSATIDTAHGTSVYYYTSENDSSTKSKYGITSKELASIINKELVNSGGRYDRGIQDGSTLYVLRHTTMPAILTECAFLSNPEECKLLDSDAFCQKLANGIAAGIIKALKQMGRI